MLSRKLLSLVCLVAFSPSGPIQAQSTAAEYVNAVVTILEERGSLDVVSTPPIVFKVLRSKAQPVVYENWIYRWQKDFQQIEIQYTVHNSEFSESYSLLKSELIYATESQRTTQVNDSMSFTVNYFVKDGQIVHMSSNGHGKTEEDGWSPQEDLNARYKKRIKQLQIALKARRRP